MIAKHWKKVLSFGMTSLLLTTSLSTAFATTKKASTETTSQTSATIGKESVNMRTTASTEAKVVATLAKGQTVAIESVKDGWCKVKVNDKTGYVREDLLETLPTAAVNSKSSNDTVAETKANSQPVQNESADLNQDQYLDMIEEEDSTSMQQSNIATKDALEAPGTTTKKLGTTEAQTYLKQLGFYAGTPDGSTGNMTTAAIKAFQTSYDLSIDGQLGEETDERLIEAVEENDHDYDAAHVKVSSNGVILAEWFNGMKQIVPNYEHLRVVDVATGEEFKLRPFSLGNHADVEPPTKEDTNTLYRINGYKWSWTPRSIWVYINDQAYAAAINVQPHGPDTIPDNGMSGQICMHFLYSRQHNTGQENKNLQAAIWTAFEKSANAPKPGTTVEKPVQTTIEPLQISEADAFALIEEEN